jgi:hypothetical protein
MKTPLLFLSVALLCTAELAAQTADDLVTQGRALLPGNLLGAYADFNAAAALSPTNETANALAAAARILSLPQQPAGSNFLNRLGLPAAGRDLLNWTADFPPDTQGHTILPANFNTTEGITAFSNSVQPAISASLANLAQITHPDFLLTLTAGETGSESVTVDYGDVLLLRAMLYGAAFVGHTADAHNFSVVINHLHDLSKANKLTIQQVLTDYPSLLKPGSKTELAASQAALTNAIAYYLMASDFIRNTRPPDAERLFTLSANDLDKEAAFREYIAKVPDSLSQPVLVDTNSPVEVFAGAYFSGATSVRSLLPKFDGDAYVYNSLPDYTFGGVLVDAPACDVEAALRKLLDKTYAGIYTGDLYSYTMNEYTGSFAVMVQTNQQATVVGFDYVQDTGFYQKFTIDRSGNWEFDTNGVYSWGNVYGDGSLEGEAGAENGSWGYWLWGQRLSDTGLLQGVAGLYAGTWSGGGSSGKLYGILSADGQIFFCTIQSNGDVGDGGTATLDSTGHFTSTSASGASVQGALNSAALKLTGTFNSSGNSGSWTLNRQSSIPFDLPPTLASTPQSRSAPVGATVTFSVAAAGSPPLSYQWYSNDVAITRANAASLVLSNIDYSSAAAYSVSIRNLAGETNASATLAVVPESIAPKITIQTPKAGLRVSNELNSVFLVGGTATDNAGVSNVWYQLNGGDWTNAVLDTTNWTGAITLASRTNLLSAFAVDTSANLSPTTSVSFTFISTHLLQIEKNGSGTLKPDYSNVKLEVGQNYVMTAKPTGSFVFSNWMDGAGLVLTNGPTLKFTMQTNLDSLVVNFIPNPFLSVAGMYAGLFFSTNADGVTPTNAGYFTATVTKAGGFTAKLQQPAKAYALNGQFSPGGDWASASVKGAPDLGVWLHLGLDGGNEITGQISNSVWASEIAANLMYFSKISNAPEAGHYTLAIPGSADAAQLPGGHGAAAVNVSAAGAVSVSGTLGDGTAWTEATFVAKNGQWPLYAPLYSKKGILIGWLTFTSGPGATNDLEGVVAWIKPGQTGSKLYPAGFEWPYDPEMINAFGSAFASQTPLLSTTNTLLILDNGNLPGSLTNSLMFGAGGKAGGTNRLSVTVTTSGTKAGLFKGSITSPAGKAIPFNGALLQKQDAGYGTFLGTNQSGSVLIRTLE